jgi:hypothetical protein
MYMQESALRCFPDNWQPFIFGSLLLLGRRSDLLGLSRLALLGLFSCSRRRSLLAFLLYGQVLLK